MELQILIVIAVTASCGFFGGIIFAWMFELDSDSRHRRNLRENRRAARRARNAKRKAARFNIELF